MKKKITLLLSLLFTHPSVCTSLGSSGSTTASNNKQQINFYGILTTHQGQTDTVDHILIEGKHNDIIMYDTPVKHAKEKFNSTTKQTEIKLDANPVTDFSKTKFDLSEITEIHIPNPNILWVYQKEKKHQKIEFAEVKVTKKENTEAKSYLLEHRAHITCNSIDKSGSQKKEVPLSAVDKLTIEGYSFTVGSNKKETKTETPSTCSAIKTETETTTEVMVK